MIAGRNEQTNTSDRQDQELAFVQHSAEATWIAVDLVDPEMVWTPPPTGKRGGQQQFSEAAIQTCLTLKVLFGMPLRQTTGFVESLLQLVGLDWTVPDFSTLCRRQKTLNVNLPYRGSTGPLNLLIGSTGIEAEGEGEWNARKHPSHRNRVSTAGQWAALECPILNMNRLVAAAPFGRTRKAILDASG